MALKILKKEDAKPEPPQRLPEGADRFVWTELPVIKSARSFAEVLKFDKEAPKTAQLTNDT